MKWIPNFLTLFRIILIPLIILTFNMENPVEQAQVATALFLIASLTDLLDGWLARKLKAVSSFGAMMDPIADKLLTSAVLICFVYQERTDVLPVVIIVVRELLVSGMREYVASNGVSIPVTKLAKWKTTTQFIAITLLFAYPAFVTEYNTIHRMGTLALWFAALLTLITGLLYVVKTVKVVQNLPPPGTKLLPAPKIEKLIPPVWEAPKPEVNPQPKPIAKKAATPKKVVKKPMKKAAPKKPAAKKPVAKKVIADQPVVEIAVKPKAKAKSKAKPKAKPAVKPRKPAIAQ